jgi:hypothetical protein
LASYGYSRSFIRRIIGKSRPKVETTLGRTYPLAVSGLGSGIGGSVRERVLKALVRHPAGLARQALAQVADVPSTTLAALLQKDPLRDLITEEKADRAPGGGGPRPKIIRLRGGLCVAGVEIGHGHIRVAVAGLDGHLWPDGEGRYFDQVVMPVFRERRRTLNWIAGGPEGTPGSLCRRLDDVFAVRAGMAAPGTPVVLGVGISVAGPVDPTDGRLVCVRPAEGMILNEEEGSIACADWDGESASQGLRDRLLGGTSCERFGWLHTEFRSDSASELCAKAELSGGELSEADFAILVKWTGSVSAAVVLEGHVVVGSRGLAGGFPLYSQLGGARDGDAPSRRLPLGIEVGIRRLRNQLAGELGLREKPKDELLRDYFRKEILSIARGERRGPREKELVTRYLADAAALLGENLAPTVDMLDPSKVVIGGGVFERRDWPFVAEPLFEGIRSRIAIPGKAPDVTLARYQDHPALRGAIAARLDTDSVVASLLKMCEAGSPPPSVAPPVVSSIP